MKQYLGIIVPKQHDALRLDAFLKKVLPPLERITVLRMLKDKEIRVEKKSSSGGAVETFKLEPIEQHSFKSSVLQLLQETEPMVISSSASHYVLASSATDRKKRSELPKVDCGLKVSAGDVVMLPKWVSKLFLESEADPSKPLESNIPRDNCIKQLDLNEVNSSRPVLTQTRTQALTQTQNQTQIQGQSPTSPLSTSSQISSTLPITSEDLILSASTVNNDCKDGLIALGYGSAMVSQRLTLGPDSLSGQSRMSLAEARELEAKLMKWVLYQDDYVLVLNKPYDMAVHQGTKISRAGHVDKYLDAVDVLNREFRKDVESPTSSPIDLLMSEFGGGASVVAKSDEDGDELISTVSKKQSKSRFLAPKVPCLERPRLVHRIDRECSGLLIVAKTRLAAKALGAQFAGLSLDSSTRSQHDEEDVSSLFTTSSIMDASVEAGNNVPLTGLEAYQRAMMPNHVRKAFKIAKTYWAITTPFNFAHVSDFTKHTAALYGIPGFTLTSASDDSSNTSRSPSQSKMQVNGIRTTPVAPLKTKTRIKDKVSSAISSTGMGFTSVVESIVEIMRKQWKSLSLIDSSRAPSTAGQIDLPIDYAKFEAPSKIKQKQKALRGKNGVILEAAVEKILVAVSMFVEMKRLANKCSLVAMQPLTGRKHQLRIHCADPEGLDAPIIGDKKYSSSKHVTSAEFYDQIRKFIEEKYRLHPGQAHEKAEEVLSSLHLHCRAMTFQHPAFCRELSRIVSDEERLAILERVTHEKKQMEKSYLAPTPSNMTLFRNKMNTTTTAPQGLVTVVAPLPEHMQITMETFGAIYDPRPDIAIE